MSARFNFIVRDQFWSDLCKILSVFSLVLPTFPNFFFEISSSFAWGMAILVNRTIYACSKITVSYVTKTEARLFLLQYMIDLLMSYPTFESTLNTNIVFICSVNDCVSSCTYLNMCNIYAYMRIVPLGDINLKRLKPRHTI